MVTSRSKRWNGLLRAAAFAFVLAPSTAGAAPSIFQLEGGTVDKKNTYDEPTWDEVTLKYTYENPVILAIPNTNGGNPADFRIRNITHTSFELNLAEPPSEDGPHVAMTIAYVAVEAGVFKLPDGRKVAAGFTDTSQVVFKNGGGFVTVPLPSTFTNPIVLAQIQGQANETGSIPAEPSKPWISTSVRNVTSGSFELALDGGECFSGALAAPERVGWMAIDGNAKGVFTDDDGVTVVYETIRTGDVIDGWDDGGTGVPFAQPYGVPPRFIAKLQTRNSQDGGWLRYGNLSWNGVTLVVDEDRCQDQERQHPGESAGLFVFSASFRVKDQDPDGDGFASSVDNCPFVFNPDQADVDDDGKGDVCDCGDGKLVDGEACDDGNTVNGDGCSAQCTIEPSGQGGGGMGGMGGTGGTGGMGGMGGAAGRTVELYPLYGRACFCAAPAGDAPSSGAWLFVVGISMLLRRGAGRRALRSVRS